jgi:hypothetical protein
MYLSHVIKLEHLFHPIRTARYAQALLAEHRRMLDGALRSERDYASDPRYRLQSVTDGFASRLEEAVDDRPLLERICAAYIKATERQACAREEYGATPWWRNIQRNGLSPVRQALAARDLEKLQLMYRNFFRDPCGTGLVARPPGRATSYFGSEISDQHGRFVLGDTLYRIDRWRAQTADRFPVSDLHGTTIGNPFGILLEGAPLTAGAPYQHYCAQRILELRERSLPVEDSFARRKAIVAEIGGGYGGMAYYLLRAEAAITYLDFDLPESLALTAYYLAKSMPDRPMLLYGEEDFAPGVMSSYDVILMPPCELGGLSTHTVDITFSSHALSDLTAAAQSEYVREIARVTSAWLLNIGRESGCEALRSLIEAHHPSLASISCCPSEWNSFRVPHAKEVEQLYGVRS